MAKKPKNKLTSANAISHEPKEDMDWRARSDCMTLGSAHEIMEDKKRHGAAKKHAAEEAKRMSKIAHK